MPIAKAMPHSCHQLGPSPFERTAADRLRVADEEVCTRLSLVQGETKEEESGLKDRVL